MPNAGACAIPVPFSPSPIPFVSPLDILSCSACCYRPIAFLPTLVPRHPRFSSFLHEGNTPLRSIAPTCATLALLPPSSSSHYHRCWRQQVDGVYRLGIATMQPIFRRNYHLPSLFYSLFVSLEKGREKGRAKEKETLVVTPGTRLKNVAP